MIPPGDTVLTEEVVPVTDHDYEIELSPDNEVTVVDSNSLLFQSDNPNSPIAPSPASDDDGIFLNSLKWPDIMCNK